MPVETVGDYIRVRVRDPELFEKFRWQTVSEEKGIAAVWGKYKDRSEWDVQAFRFDKDKWTESEAETWVTENKDSFTTQKDEASTWRREPMAGNLKELQKVLRARGLRCAAQAIALPKELKEWIHLMPVGHWEEFRGGGPGYGEPMDITGEHIKQMAANFTKYLNPILFDYEHESCWGNTRAAGWIVEVAAKDDGLWGRVEWTPTAQQEILEGEYRYCSPMWDFNYQDPKTGERVGARLHSAALTNTPFFEDLEQKLAAKEGKMDELKKVAAALGLAETATLDEILAAITKLKEAAPAAAKKLEEMLTAARNELRLPATATSEEMVAAIKARGAGESELAQKVQKLEEQNRKTQAAALIEKYQAAGKLVKADIAWAQEQAEKDPAAFEKFMASAPVKIPPETAHKTMPVDADGKPAPTATELAVAEATGVPAANIAAQRAKREQNQG